MGAIISSDYPGMDALQNRLTAARAANIGRLTAARGTLMDNLPRLNTKIKGASYVASAQFNLPTSRAWIELFSSTQAESCYLFMAFKRNYSAVDIGTGASGSETVLVNSIDTSNSDGTEVWCMPVKIPAGTRIAARGYGYLGIVGSMMLAQV